MDACEIAYGQVILESPILTTAVPLIARCDYHGQIDWGRNGFPGTKLDVSTRPLSMPPFCCTVRVKWGKQKFEAVELNTDEPPTLLKTQLFSLSGTETLSKLPKTTGSR